MSKGRGMHHLQDEVQEVTLDKQIKKTVQLIKEINHDMLWLVIPSLRVHRWTLNPRPLILQTRTLTTAPPVPRRVIKWQHKTFE